MRHLFGLCLSAALLAAFSYPVFANGEGAIPCTETFKAAAQVLKQKFGEVPVARLLKRDGQQLYVIFRDPVDDSWSITLTRSNSTCLMASGDGWQTIPVMGDPL